MRLPRVESEGCVASGRERQVVIVSKASGWELKNFVENDGDVI